MRYKLKKMEGQIQEFYRSKGDDVNLPAGYKYLDPLFEIILATEYEISLNRKAFGILRKLAVNEKTKDWVEGYLRKNKVVKTVKNQLVQLLDKFYMHQLDSKNMHDDEDDTPYQGPKAATRTPGDYDDEESGSEEYDEEDYNDMANRYGASAQRWKERKDLS